MPVVVSRTEARIVHVRLSGTVTLTDLKRGFLFQVREGWQLPTCWDYTDADAIAFGIDELEELARFVKRLTRELPLHGRIAILVKHDFGPALAQAYRDMHADDARARMAVVRAWSEAEAWLRGDPTPGSDEDAAGGGQARLTSPGEPSA